ncbi:hypothetical protein M2284_004514 [Rhodococcus sp. LBL1]|nr:hypothetical protein [Rhodococcus sp. LBL1]MDH6685717.1 hypothetical protein [Rhodococcus sp. LBL2]
MDTLHGVRKWAVSAAITARSTEKIHACVVDAVEGVATGDPEVVGARAGPVAATCAQPSCFCCRRTRCTATS